MSIKLFKLLAPCLIVLCVSLNANAQTATATLGGSVEDQNGAAIPGVSVTVENVGTRIKRVITTNDRGVFAVPLLPPGEYTITFTREGFASVLVSDVVLHVADQKSLAIQLKVGDASAPTVDVTAEAFLVNTGTSVATTIDETFVRNLPLNGRSFLSLALLTPGAVVGDSGAGGQFSVNGHRPNTNYFMVDGVSANIGIETSLGGVGSVSAAGGLPGVSAIGGTNNLVSQDALQEFKIQTSTYSAESGRQPGGQVQVVTKSGDNTFRLALFEYFRNEALDARNYFNKEPSPQTPLRQNFYGGTFGGPVMLPKFGDGGSSFYNGKNRTFFFFSYEGQRLKQPRLGVTQVPSLRLRDLVPAALKPILNAFPIPSRPELRVTCLPGPNESLCGPDPVNPSQNTKLGGFAEYDYSIANPIKLDATSIRINHSINGSHSIFGRFNESPSESETFSGGANTVATKSATRTLTLGATSILRPDLTNELRVNFSRQLAQGENHLISFGGAVPFDSNLVLGEAIAFSTMTFSLGNVATPTINVGSIAKNYQRQINLANNLTLLKGDHQLKFGVDYRRMSPIISPSSFGILNFIGEPSVVSGTVFRLTLRNQVSTSPVFTNISFFGQDTWKASSRLTLDFGLRYELNPVPTEPDGKYPLVALGITNPPEVSGARLAPQGTPFFKPFYLAFAPRFGVAYQLHNAQGKETVIRGGAGVYYDLGTTTAAAGYPLFVEKQLNSIPFPLSVSDRELPPVTHSVSLTSAAGVKVSAENLKYPISYQWSLGVEQSFGKHQVASVSYVGSADRRLFMGQTINQSPGGNQPRPNPNFGNITFYSNGPSGDYHSMQAQYRARLNAGLSALINYTWSHAIDEISSDFQPGQLERGNANFDVRHNFSSAFHYDIPRVRKGRVWNSLINGWGVDAIIFAQTGKPINVSGVGSRVINGEQISGRPDLVLGQPFYIKDPSVPGGRRFNPLAFTVPPAGRQGNFGRNVLRELPLVQTDLALSRTFGLMERGKLQLKGEVFNVFNHPMFGSYRPSAGLGLLFGVPNRTLNSQLGGLSDIYQFGGPRSIQLSARVEF